MSKYNLLGKTIEFSQSEDEFYHLQAALWKAVSEGKDTYDFWYKSQKSIVEVIQGSESFVRDIQKNTFLIPLYPELAKKYQLFGIGKSEFIDACVDASAIDDIRLDAIEVYDNIQEQMELEIEEREYNNELRKAGQISFGIGDTLKNAASNAAHGIATSGGNASSREKAAERKSKLYKDLKEPLWEAIKDSYVVCAKNYQIFVNSRVPDSINANYDRESSSAYLENAKAIPEKREDLIAEAFTKCPWNEEIYLYVFENYSQERRNIISISKVYDISLAETINKFLRAEYTSAAKKNEQLALQAKSKIKELMTEWGVENSPVIDEIELDCLDRLTDGLETADEARCNEIKKQLQEYEHAVAKNKEKYFVRITQRIESIWAKEDGDIFDNYLLQINILSASEVEEGKEYVKEKGRTADAKKYLVALEHCNKANVDRARKYQRMNASPKTFLKYVGWIFILVGAVLLFVQEDFSFVTQILPIVAGIVYQGYISSLKKEWEAITVGGKVINPILNLSAKDFGVSCTKAEQADSCKKQASKGKEGVDRGSDGQ